ncbi:MAG TPA: PilZ domain-containing protein [Tepidisphaeraceae bacterium]|nr:PilZ domain-containing protein [Tepidisphaeraceae bacterium]
MDELSLPPMPKYPRRSDRVDKQQFVQVKLYRNGAEFTSQSRMVDFSALGVGLLHPHHMDLGEQFSITIVQADGHKQKLLYSVIYCNSDSETSGFHIGGEFLCAVPVAA